MKKTILLFITVLCLDHAYAQSCLTNDDISYMYKSQVKEEVILKMIDNSYGCFCVGLDDIVSLTKEGVSSSVIIRMIGVMGKRKRRNFTRRENERTKSPRMP